MQTLCAFLPSSPLPARQMWKEAGRELSSMANMSRQLVKSSLQNEERRKKDNVIRGKEEGRRGGKGGMSHKGE